MPTDEELALVWVVRERARFNPGTVQPTIDAYLAGLRKGREQQCDQWQAAAKRALTDVAYHELMMDFAINNDTPPAKGAADASA